MNDPHVNTTISPALCLVLTNLLVIGIALLNHWSILTLLWGYWLQSIIIGLFTGIKILMFGRKNPRKKGILSSFQDSLSFTCHYGSFHIFYLVFLYFFTTNGSITMTLTPPDYRGIALIGTLFFLSHLYSFVQHYIWERKTVFMSTNQVFLEPYKRIFPMNLMIVAAGFFTTLIPTAETPLLIVFLMLKTFADLKSHQILHQSDTYQTFRHTP